MTNFASSRSSIVVTALLAGQIGIFYAYPKTQSANLNQPLDALSREWKGWRMSREFPIETEVQALLRADSTLNRQYVRSNEALSLFIAFFKTQSTGVAPHSPKVCLPGSGWTPSESTISSVPVQGFDEPVHVNRYLIERGSNKNVVLYWYQTHNRTVASEYMAKIYTVLDSVRYRRDDTSLVRVIAPVNGQDIAAADKVAVEFVQDFFPLINNVLPR